jgi:trans-aconitate 2-methyltransferase
VPDHERLLRRWFAVLPPGAWVAWQVPDNLDEPSHALMREVAADGRWRDALAHVHRAPVPAPEDYARLVLDAGWQADVWRTTYVHVLAGDDPVLDWVRGTGLRPYLQALGPDDAVEFEAAYAARLRAAYPPASGRTLLRFPRTFAVAHRPSR